MADLLQDSGHRNPYSLRRSSPGYNKRSRMGSPRDMGETQGFYLARYDYEYGGNRGYADVSTPTWYHHHSDWAELNYGIFGDVLASTQRYKEYRDEYIATQKRAYFELHKEEEWLKDKYHPTNIQNAIKMRNNQARSKARDFSLDLQNGTLDIGSGLTAEQGNGGIPVSVRRAPPVSSKPCRILADIEQAAFLIRKLDSEKGITEDNNLIQSSMYLDDDAPYSEPFASSKPLFFVAIIQQGSCTDRYIKGVELLDTLLTYLYRVHGVDYYGMREMSEPEGPRHVRGVEGEGEVGPASDEWEKQLDTYWSKRLDGQDMMERLAWTERIEAAIIDAHFRREKEKQKQGCRKRFHSPKFVHEHLKVMYVELVAEITREELYFQNYMDDPNAPGEIPDLHHYASDGMRRMKRKEFGHGDGEEKSSNKKRRANGELTRGEERSFEEARLELYSMRGPPITPLRFETPRNLLVSPLIL